MRQVKRFVWFISLLCLTACSPGDPDTSTSQIAQQISPTPFTADTSTPIPASSTPTRTPTASATATRLPPTATLTPTPTPSPTLSSTPTTAATPTSIPAAATPTPSSTPTEVSMTPTPLPAGEATTTYQFLAVGPAQPELSQPCPGCPRAPGYIVGHVVDAQGVGLAGIRLLCYNDWHRYPIIASKGGGEYDFPILQAETTWYVVILDENDQPLSPEAPVAFNPQQACWYRLNWQRVY